jgi:hypothetical protein
MLNKRGVLSSTAIWLIIVSIAIIVLSMILYRVITSLKSGF